MDNFVVKPRNKRPKSTLPNGNNSTTTTARKIKNRQAMTNGVGGSKFSGDKHERTKIITLPGAVLIDISVNLKFNDKDPNQAVMLGFMTRKQMNLHKSIEKDRLEIQFRYGGRIHRYWGYICFNESDNKYSIYVESHNGERYTKLTWQALGDKCKITDDNTTISMWAKGILQR